MKKETDSKIQHLLKQVCDCFDKEDRSVRERQLRDWRRLKLLWEGFSQVWYSEVAHDWRVWDEEVAAGSDTDQAYYDKPINVFRGYLESIIAALSITVPGIKCYPDDADNPMDTMTAAAGDKISLLLYRHNNAPLLFLHALYIICTEGMVAAYSYPREDAKYGTYEEEETEEVEEEAYICPVCGTRLADEIMTEQLMDEYQPDDESIPLHDVIINQGKKICPECASLLNPELQKSKLIVERIVGTTHKPKSRICVECYGGTYVKVPSYASKQEDIPYLIFSYETHYSNVIARYPKLRSVIGGGKSGIAAGGMYDPYEQWARLSPQYRGEFPLNNITVRNCWLRPSAFEVLNEEDANLLKKHYPDGAKVVLVNDMYADAENENLDDCWTIMIDPMADYIHKKPMGSLLVNVQDITNDIISLALQTIEHGISQTFADPSQLNFEEYGQTEVVPGGVYPAVAKSGKALGEGFFETRTATLSSEVLPFFNQIQTLGQMASGALPSLFGGQIEGSKTASEYSMSRAQALQRLQNTWKMVTYWWKDIFGKAIPMYIKEVHEDEKSVDVDEKGNFVNVFVRIAELEGKIGRVELEANENLPITWSQRKDTYMKLLEAQNPLILEALTSPENVKNLAEAIGLEDFVIPGQADIDKQNEEIRILANTEPIMQPPSEEDILMSVSTTGQVPPPMEIPSVEVEPDVDNHEIEAEVCRHYLVSPAGRLLKVESPEGYKNILLHMKAHLEILKMRMMEEMQAQAMANPNQEKSPGSNQPLSENENVATQS